MDKQDFLHLIENMKKRVVEEYDDELFLGNLLDLQDLCFSLLSAINENLREKEDIMAMFLRECRSFEKKAKKLP